MKKNKKLPVTNFDMTRFLLPLHEAVDLVFFALFSGENGYTYVRKSPACTLETLVKSLCHIFSYKKGYFEVGIRAGEKMNETLVTQEELLRAVNVKKYYKIPPESQGLDYNQYFFRGNKIKRQDVEPFTSENTTRLDITETTNMLLKLPEIQHELKTIKA
jgi:UDP-glucose 4-epimerase